MRAGRDRTVRGVVNTGVIGPARAQTAVLPEVTDLDPEADIGAVRGRAGNDHAIAGMKEPRGPVADGERRGCGDRLAGGGRTDAIPAIDTGVRDAVHTVKSEVEVILDDCLRPEVRRVERRLPILIIRAGTAVEVKAQGIAAPGTLGGALVNHPAAGLIGRAEGVVGFLQAAVNGDEIGRASC